MLIIYEKFLEFTADEIKVVSDSESRLLKNHNFILAINCGSISFSINISAEQFFKIAQIFEMDYRKFTLCFNKLLNVNLLKNPVECVVHTSNDTDDFYITDKNNSLCLNFRVDNEFIDEISFIEICKFIEQELQKSVTTVS